MRLQNLIPLILAFSCASIKDHLVHQGSEKTKFDIKRLWVRSTLAQPNFKFRKINRMTPILFNTTLIQANAIDGISAYDLESGQEKWRTLIRNGAEANALLASDKSLKNNFLYVAASDGLFYSLNPIDGKIIWSIPLKAEGFSEPLLDKGVLYVLNGNNVLFAIDAKTGKISWTYNRNDTSTISVRGGTKPAIWRDHLLVGFSDGSLGSLNVHTGAMEWEAQLNKGKRFRDIDADPVVDQDRVYVSSFDDQLFCLNPANGEVIWKSEGGGFGKVVLVNDMIIYPITNGSSGGEVIALRKKDGEKLWTYKNKEGVATQIQPYLNSENKKALLVFGESKGDLVFINAQDGSFVSSFDPGRGILATPLIEPMKNRIYFISGEANLYAMEAKWNLKNAFPFLN